MASTGVVREHYEMLIDGALVESRSGRRRPSINPATGREITDFPEADEHDVGLAVEAARSAFARWRRTPLYERAKLVRGLAQRIREHAQQLAYLDAVDSGNPITAMKSDVEMGCERLDFFAGLASEMKGDTLPLAPGRLHLTLREPYGVVSRIVPFNHPIMFAVTAIAAPLMAGNTVVLKPSEHTSLSALELGRIARDVLPKGVVNVVTGGAQVGAAMVSHPAIKRIAFTGSVGTARRIMVTAAEAGIKHVTLELGGKNPMIVFPDADPDKVAAGLVKGMNFRWCQSQSCGSTSRVFVHEDLYEDLLPRLAKAMGQVKIGIPINEDTEMGALTYKEHYQKVLNYIEIGQREGAAVVAGGERPSGPEFANGFFLKPTLLGGVTQNMTVAREEIFGPVVSTLKWRDVDQVIEQANEVMYGLTASVWTNDLRLAGRMIESLDTGYVWINDASAHFLGMPFGGHKASGLGTEETLEELLSYTQLKSVNMVLTE